MQSIFRALQYIESHLDQDISIKQLSEVSFISQFHMARVFKTLTGYSPMEYVRYRRLTEAAKQLALGNETVLSIGLGVGYNSHASFTKAFINRFQITPKTCKEKFELLKYKFVEPIKNLNIMSISISKPKIVEHVNLTIAGLVGHSGNADQIFNKVYKMQDKIKHISMPAVCNAIWFDPYNENKEEFYNFVGFPVMAAEDLPKDVEAYPIYLKKAAVFEHTGDYASFQKFSASVHGEWFPKSDLEYSGYESDYLTSIQMTYESDKTDSSKSLEKQQVTWLEIIPIQ